MTLSTLINRLIPATLVKGLVIYSLALPISSVDTLALEPNKNFRASEALMRKKARAQQAKALCLYNFVNFVEWPEDAFAKKSNLKLCLVGQTSFGGFLDTVDGTFVGDRQLQVVRSADGEDPEIQKGCHIVFVDFDQQDKLEFFFSNFEHKFVLSVGDQPGFADDWGTVNIHRIRDGAQIEVNLQRVFNSGLRISSDLLGIAKIVNFEEAMRASR
jgi:hypothetical protein